MSDVNDATLANLSQKINEEVLRPLRKPSSRRTKSST